MPTHTHAHTHARPPTHTQHIFRRRQANTPADLLTRPTPAGEALLSLTNLRTLRINGCDNVLGAVWAPALQQLPLLRAFKTAFWDPVTLAGPILCAPHLRELEMAICSNRHVPESHVPPLLARVFELTALTKLNLANSAVNDAAHLEGIGALSQLRWLSLLGTRVKELPPDVTDLSRLTYLDVGWNILGELPDALFSLTQLEV